MFRFLFSAWQAGLRSRSIQAVLVLGVLMIGMAYLSAFFSHRQSQTVALDVGLSGLRISLVLFALFWVQELFGREIERRSVMFALTYPVSRSRYVLGRYLGVVSLLALATLLLGLLLWVAVFSTRSFYDQWFPVQLGAGFWWAVAAIWVDVALVAAFSLCLAALSTVPMLPLALGLAFAIGGRSLGAVVDYIASGDGDAQVMALRPVIEAIQWVLPDLSRLDWRAVPMYALAPDWSAMVWSLVMAGAYIALMLALASWVFSRRQFD